jgi:hypothetical protein
MEPFAPEAHVDNEILVKVIASAPVDVNRCLWSLHCLSVSEGQVS